MPDACARAARALLAALLCAASAGASAQPRVTYCCEDETGRKACGDILPQACYGRAYREIDERGMTVRRVEAPLTPEQRAQRDAEARRKRALERLAAEERRRNQALLDAYGSEKDIEFARQRALRDIELAIQQAQERHDGAAQRRGELMREMEFYSKKAPPKELADAVKDNESELRAHQSVIEAKQKEMDSVRDKYDEEKRRYLELTRGRGANGIPSAESPRDTRSR